MKVLVLTTCYPRRRFPNHGIFVHLETRALADLGVDCRVLQPVNWSPLQPLHLLDPSWNQARNVERDMLDEVEGIRVYHPRVYLPRPSRFFPGDYWERVGRSVGRFIRRNSDLRDADLIYAHFLCHEGYAGLIAARELGMPLAAIARGDDVHGWPERWPDRRPKLAAVLREANGLLACSKALAKDAANFATDGLSTPIEVVYAGINTANFHPAANAEEQRRIRDHLGLPTNRLLLLSVATPIVAKGWLDLLDAFTQLGESAGEWDLVMVGSPRGSDDLNLMTEVKMRGLVGRAHWLGCLSPSRMPDLYRACDAFVLASHNEGLSNSVVEAMATGLPVVATDVGGHSEVIEDRISGWLVARRDVQALTAALDEALNDREAALRIARMARQCVGKVGDHRQNASRLLRYFEQMISVKTRTRREKVAV